MGFTEALRLVIDADTRGAVQGLEKLGATADRELSRSQTSLDKWGNRLTSVGAGMIAFGGAALVGLGAMAKASEDAQLSTLKLENTISNMPKLAGENSKQFTDLAQSIQKVTAADGDAIVEAEALLGTFNLTAQQIKGITPLVVDYARKFGVDMADAAVQVGKALDGNVGALKRNGVSIDEVLFKTDRYTAVQQALSDQVGGFAEAEGKTFAGSLARMRNELGDLAEGVGGGAVDAFTTMFGAVEKVTGALESVSPGAQNAIGKIATFGAVGLIAAGGLSTLIGQALKAADNFSALASGTSTLIGKMGGLRAAAGLAAGAAGLAGLVVAASQVDDGFEGVHFDRMVEGLLSTSSATRKNLTDFITLIDSTGQLNNAFDQVAAQSAPAAERFIELAEAAGVSKSKIKELQAGLEEKKAADVGATAAQSEYNAEVDQAAGITDKAATATQDATDALKDYTDALRAQFDPLFGAVSAANALADANSDVTEKEQALAAAIRDHGAGSAEATAAEDELTRARIDASSAALDQESALATLVDTVRKQPGALDTAKAHLQSWVNQGFITQETADATAAKLDEVTGAAGRIPVAVTTNVSSTGATQTAADLNALKAKIDAIPREINIITRMTTLLSGSTNTPRAQGGPVKAGEAYIVGEHQPELFVPNENGVIWPSLPSTVPGGSFGGGGTTVNYQLVFNGPTNDLQVIDAIKRFERTNGSGWRN